MKQVCLSIGQYLLQESHTNPMAQTYRFKGWIMRSFSVIHTIWIRTQWASYHASSQAWFETLESSDPHYSRGRAQASLKQAMWLPPTVLPFGLAPVWRLRSWGTRFRCLNNRRVCVCVCVCVCVGSFGNRLSLFEIITPQATKLCLEELRQITKCGDTHPSVIAAAWDRSPLGLCGRSSYVVDLDLDHPRELSVFLFLVPLRNTRLCIPAANITPRSILFTLKLPTVIVLSLYFLSFPDEHENNLGSLRSEAAWFCAMDNTPDITEQ